MKTEVTKYEDGELVIAVEGQVDVTTAPVFSEDINRIRAEKPDGKIVFDLDHLIYISSAGFRVFLALMDAENERGKKIKLINVNPVIAEVFDDTGFSALMEVEVKTSSLTP